MARYPTGDPEVVRDSDASQYELVAHGSIIAVVEYVEGESDVVLTHTFVPVEHRSRGNARRLVIAVLDDLRLRGLKVVPGCSYVAAFLRRSHEYGDLVATPIEKPFTMQERV